MATSEKLTAPRMIQAVVLPRRHVLALALLTCLPVPLVSMVTTFMHVPDLIDRTAASVVPFAVPTLGSHPGRVVREDFAPVRSLNIVSSQSERPVVAWAVDGTKRSAEDDLPGDGDTGGAAAPAPPGADKTGSTGRSNPQQVREDDEPSPDHTIRSDSEPAPTTSHSGSSSSESKDSAYEHEDESNAKSEDSSGKHEDESSKKTEDSSGKQEDESSEKTEGSSRETDDPSGRPGASNGPSEEPVDTSEDPSNGGDSGSSGADAGGDK